MSHFRHRKLASLLAMGTLLLSLGCGDGVQPPAPSTLAPPTFGTATITGRVRFLGTPPERAMVDTSTCHAGAKPVQEETIVVGPDQGLRDVIVSIKNAPPSDGTNQPTLTLDQSNCRYEPHVLAIQRGQPLRITTSDPVFHNVHWLSGTNGDKNFGMPAGSAAQVVRFAAADSLRVRCDVHPWMEAWVGVMESPFFAVTDREGRFTIPKVPAGTYTLAAWHPILGDREATVEVAADGTATAAIDYAPPAR